MPGRSRPSIALARRREGGGAPLRLGYVASAEAAPLLVAQEAGLFAREGLDVRLSSEVGWAAIRDKLAAGELDAAHACSGSSLTLAAGIETPACDVVVGFIFNHFGSPLTLAPDLWRTWSRDAAGSGGSVRALNHRVITLAVGSRASAHFFALRRWLEAAGLNPQRGVRLLVLPTSQLPSTVRAGLIDGFCAGEPWTSMAEAEGARRLPLFPDALGTQFPDTVLLAAGARWREQVHESAAVQRALTEACRWCADPDRRSEIAAWLAASGLVRASPAPFENALSPAGAGNGRATTAPSFAGHLPTGEQGRRVARELARHGVVPPGLAAETLRLASRVWQEPPLDEPPPVRTRSREPKVASPR